MHSKARNVWRLTPFGKKVKKKTIERGMTLSELATEISVNRSYLSQVLYGKKRGDECKRKINLILGLNSNDEEGKVVGK